MIEEHLLGQGRALAERKQLQHRIFLAGQMDPAAVDLDRLGVEVDRDLAGPDDRLRMTLRAADDRVDPGDQLVAVERLGDVIIGAEAQRTDLAVHFADARQNEDRSADLGGSQLLEHVVAVHVRQVQIQKDDVVIVELAEIEALFAKIRRVDVKAFGPEHQLDALGGRRLVFNEQHAHWLFSPRSWPGRTPWRNTLLMALKPSLTIRGMKAKG